jgi:hypothetical protein
LPENLHSVTFVCHHNVAGRIERNSHGVIQLAVARSLCIVEVMANYAPERSVSFEELYSMVLAIGDHKNRASLIHCYPRRAFQLPIAAAPPPDGAQESTLAIKYLHTIVPPVCHSNVAGAIHSHSHWKLQLALCLAPAANRTEESAVVLENLQPVIARICHNKVALSTYCDTKRHGKLPLFAAGPSYRLKQGSIFSTKYFDFIVVVIRHHNSAKPVNGHISRGPAAGGWPHLKAFLRLHRPYYTVLLQSRIHNQAHHVIFEPASQSSSPKSRVADHGKC